MKKLITPFDTIRTFYATEELLPTVLKKSKQPLTIERLEKLLKEKTEKAENISDKKLLSYHLDHYHVRYDNYINSSWEIKDVELRDCGVWPEMGNLPEEFTYGSVVDTADVIKPYLSDKSKLTWETSRILYIEQLMKYAEIITQYFPIILLEDHVIRHTKHSRQNIDNFKRTKYDIDDGAHRAVALALSGIDKVKAYVGKRIYKSPYLYY